MSVEPEAGKDEESLETERQAASMQDQLNKEVSSWSKARRGQSSETVIASAQRVTKPRLSRPVNEARKSSAPLAAGTPVRSKPFSMSYAGMTQAEYTQYLRDQGAR